jgi:hypothetical protein
LVYLETKLNLQGGGRGGGKVSLLRCSILFLINLRPQCRKCSSSKQPDDPRPLLNTNGSSPAAYDCLACLPACYACCIHSGPKLVLIMSLLDACPSPPPSFTPDSRRLNVAETMRKIHKRNRGCQIDAKNDILLLLRFLLSIISARKEFFFFIKNEFSSQMEPGHSRDEHLLLLLLTTRRSIIQSVHARMKELARAGRKYSDYFYKWRS